MLSTAKRLLHSEDHYYWITSYLATRGLHRTTRRLIAFNLLGASLVPLILLMSDLGPKSTAYRAVAIAVSVLFMVIASLWMRSGWPSRLQSQTYAALGALGIAAGCLVQTDTAFALMVANSFVAVSAFTALFHGRRLIIFVWLVATATFVGLALRFGGFEADISIAGIMMFALTNVFVVFVCRNVVRLVNPTIHYGELESLTGLLTRDAYFDRVATMISARDRDDDRYLAIIVVSLDSFSLLTGTTGAAGGNEARVAIGHRLGETLRRDALLAHVGESEYLVADTFTSADAKVLTDRLQHAVRTAPYRLTASIGVVATPITPLVGHAPHDVIEELLTIATSNVYVARRNGGQCTRSTADPRLTSLDESDSDWNNDDLTA